MPRTCTVCRHDQLDMIDAAIVAGESNRMIANRFELSEASIQRHRAKHIPAQLAKAREAEVVTQADGLLGQVQALHSKALHILETAESAGDLRVALAGIREARGCLELEAKIRGEIDSAPVVNVLVSAEWRAVRAALMAALAPYMEARQAVAAALMRLEAPADGGTSNGHRA